MKIEMTNENELMKHLPKEWANGVEGADYGVPRATVRDLTATGWALKTHAPLNRTPLEETTLSGLVKVVEYVTLGIAESEQPTGKSPKVKGLRLSVVKGSTAIRGMVATVAESETDDVEDAAHLLKELFVGDLERIQTLSPRSAWQTVWMFERKLELNPGLRTKLNRLVPESMTARLLKNNEELGDAAGVTRQLPKEGRVDTVVIRAVLRQRMSRYAAAMLASADDADLDSIQRVKAALIPIKELRDEITRRHGRRPAEEEPEEVEETDEGFEEEEVPPASGNID